ncbi:MAG: hypothetical protein PVJ57_17370 [Phycisphaerae bacterium]|jgi:tetratricopeptide (TPR) repeat protein
MRCSSRVHRRSWWLGVVGLSLVLALGPQVGAAQPADPPPSAANTVKLNQGIAAYHAGITLGQYGEARQILEELLVEEPHNAAALYYLGLIYLSDGLQAAAKAESLSAEAEQLAAAATPDEAAVSAKAAEARKKATEARTLFAVGREHLKRVIELADRELADPHLVPVQAALFLGIAQLASQDESIRAEAAQYALDGKRTLETYVAGEGDSDPLGHFFLAVACYRLATPLESEQPVGDRAALLRQAMNELGQVRALLATEGGIPAADEARILYYEGLVLLAQRAHPQAVEKLEGVIERDEGGLLAKNAEELVGQVRRREALSPEPITWHSPIGPLRFEGDVTIGGFHDTNVILLGENTALPQGIPDEADHRFGVEAGFDITRLLTSTDDRILGETLLLGVGGTTAHFWQPSIGEFDVNSYSGRAYLNWEPFRTVYLGLQYDYAYTQLGHEPFISSHRLTPVVSKIWLRPRQHPQDPEQVLGRTDVYYSFDDRNYLDSLRDRRFDRDGNYHCVGFTQRFNIVQASQMWPGYYAPAEDGHRRDFSDAARWLSVRAGYAFRDERTGGDEFDLHGHTVLAGLDVPLPWRLSFGLAAEWTWDAYQQPSLFDFERKRRADFVQHYDFGLTRTLVGRGECSSLRTLDVRLRAGVDLTIQDSNIWNRLHEEVYSYDRFIYSVKLMVSF